MSKRFGRRSASRCSPVRDAESLCPCRRLVFLFLFFAGWCGYPKTRLPVLLNGGWHLFHVRDEGGDLPHVLLAESFLPGGHAGVTDTRSDGVEDVPLGVIRGIRD